MSRKASSVCSTIFEPFLSGAYLKRLVLLVVVEMVVALPFSSMELVPGLANLRPVVCLIPAYAYFFGPTGAWAYAIGNVLYDFFSGTLVISSIGGFIGNGLAVFLFWALRRKVGTPEGLFGTGRALTVYALASLVIPAAIGTCIAPWIAVFFPSVSVYDFFVALYANDAFFFLMPGIGICIILEKVFKFPLR